MSISKPPKGLEGKLVKLEFKGNLNTVIKTIKKNLFDELNEEQELALKCCFLFLCGMSFSQISIHINIPKETISKYLNNPNLGKLLSFEYRILFSMNQFRLELETIKEDVKKVITIFVEQNGDYEKTLALTLISAETLESYLNNPNLEEILEDNVLYDQFLKIKEIESNHVENQNLRLELEKIKPKNIVEKRYLLLCKFILIEGITDIKRLMKMTKMSETNIEKYLSDFTRCSVLFPEEILNQFQDKALSIYSNNQINCVSVEEYYRNIIQFYMENRYSYSELCEIVWFQASTSFYHVFEKKAKEYLSKEEYEELQKHKNEVTHIYQMAPRNCHVIKEKRMIDIVKPEIVYVNPYEYKVLSILVDFLDAYHNLCLKEVTEPFENIIIHLNANTELLQKLLTKEAYEEISSYLEIEKILYGNELDKKFQLITSIVRDFFMNDLDLGMTARKLDMKVETLIHILQNEFVKMNYGVIIYEYIKVAIENYREEKNKNKTSEKTYIFKQI